MVATKLNLSMTEPQVRQIYAKQGDTGRVIDITLDQTPEDGMLRILRPDGVEVTSEAVTGGEVESGGTFESLTEADVTELTVGIEPVQDLNGYDKPWVGGAGKNLLPYPYYESTKTVNGITFTVKADGSIVANGTATSNAIFLFQSGDWTISENYILNGCPSGGSGTTFSLQVQNTGSTTLYDYGSGVTLPSGTYRSILFIVRSGYTANNLTAKPMLRKATVSDPTWQPYSNICPITGHDEVRVTRTGKNLLPTFTSGTRSGLTYDVGEDGSVHVTGTCTGTTFWAVHFTLPKGTYILSGAPSGGQLTIRNGEGGGAPSSAFSGVFDDYGNGATFTVSETASAWLNIRSTAGTHDKTYYPMIRLASETDDTYEPYRSNTYATSLGQTVYGGTLDMVTGVLNVTYGYKDIDDFTRLSSGTSSGGLHVATLDGTYTENAPSVCSMLEQKNLAQAWGSTTECYAIEGNGIRVYTTETTLANFKTKFAQLQIAYELASPQTYQLTAQQIKTLVGTNNVWASSGDIVSIKFSYGGLLSELPSDATEIVGKCYCDVEQSGVSSMPFTLNVKKNERES